MNVSPLSRWLLLCAVFVAVGPISSISSVRADGSIGPAGAFIQDFGDRAINALTEEGLPTKELRSRFGKLYEEGFDSPAIGRFVLGRYWKKASKEERKKFQDLFNTFVVQTYAAKFRHYGGETFMVTGSRQSAGGSTFVISSKVEQPGGGPPIVLSWRVSESDDAYKIYDITVEGVSMVVTQRSEFTSVIRSGGGKVEALIDALRDKTTKLASKESEGGNVNN
ncbi:MAG: ABC transporter substrate-binding protein [Alphaproteobacteria bacterium]|jgi:phospholipid transport system substrate-binding protein|nr:toluene tolerance protein [Rhodospirillaceae bacterium]MDP6031047.1 ABC transporter substrate-binding protein [Alphaproteobacteria bacterium]MDP7183381.1 ABC transporter substrate-binding protein [Alphaproteobacteria bacterium]MDP7190520.1 ABC transporter substrate-binding protein [Alphaproteobacteria bacterium]HJO88205.1 ABC transporter substrate-binding protein [Alphaproteobacteria bacterium]